MKITCAEFNAWLGTGFPEGYVWRSDGLLSDGRDVRAGISSMTLRPDETFEVPPHWSLASEDAIPGEAAISVACELRRWLKQRKRPLAA